MSIYSIYGKHGTSAKPLVLSIKEGTPAQVVQRLGKPGKARKAAKAAPFLWSMREVPGTPFVYLKHDESQLYARFPMMRDQPVTLAPLDAMDRLFAMQLHSLGDGYVHIANHDRTLIFGVQGASRDDGAAITAWPWTLPVTHLYWLFGPPVG